MHIFAQPNMNLIEVMKENKYDDDRFFSQYAQMSRSVEGLQGAGEWHILQKMLPDFTDKRVLDLGCGFVLRYLSISSRSFSTFSIRVPSGILYSI